MSSSEILTAGRFYLELKLAGSKDADGIYMDCEGFKSSQEVIEVCEVTPYQWGKANKGMVRRIKLPGNVQTDNIILRRGLWSSQILWNWFLDVQQGNWAEQRRSGSLAIYDRKSVVQARFVFLDAWPTSYSISGPDANSTDFAIEELEMACEIFKRVPTNN